MSEASLNLTLAGGTADHSTVSSSTSRPASALKQRGSSRFLNNEEDENLRPLSEMSTGQEQEAEGGREEEPLLGGPGDAQQTRDDPKKLGGNLVLGTISFLMSAPIQVVGSRGWCGDTMTDSIFFPSEQAPP